MARTKIVNKKWTIFSFAKRVAYIFGFVGLLLGILYSVGGLIIDALVTLGWIFTTQTPGLSYGTLLAFGALIGMPAIGATFGFVIGLICALIYSGYLQLVCNK
jgi:hypothetical protein